MITINLLLVDQEQLQGELPSVESVGNSVAESGAARAERITTPPPQPDYATPRKDEPDVDLDPGYDDATL